MFKKFVALAGATLLLAGCSSAAPSKSYTPEQAAAAYFYYDCFSEDMLSSLLDSSQWSVVSQDDAGYVVKNSKNGVELLISFDEKASNVSGANKDQTRIMIDLLNCASQPDTVAVPDETIASIISDGNIK